MFPSAESSDQKRGAKPKGEAIGSRKQWLALLAPFLAALPLAVFGLGLVLATQVEETAQRRQDLQNIARSVVFGVDSELRSGLRALEALAGSQNLESSNFEAFRSEAQRLLAREPNWYTIALTDGARQLLNLRYPPETALPPIQDLAALGTVLRSGNSAPGGLIDGRISYRVPVRIDGALRNVLVATQESSSFSQLLNRSGIPQGWSTLLLDGAGRMIARGAGEAALLETLRDAYQQIGSIVEMDGTMALALPVGNSRWSLVLASPPPSFAAAAWVWLAVALGASSLLASFGIAGHFLRARSRQEAQSMHGHGEAMANANAKDLHRNGLIAAVSEDLRAPLSDLVGHADRLATFALPADARIWVDRQREAGQALLALVGDVLDFARLDGGTLEFEDTDIEIAPLLDDCAAQLRPWAETMGLTLQVAIDPGLPRWIRGDPMRLRQVITRLLDNGIRGSSVGATAGRVVLAARLTPRSEAVEVAVTDAAPPMSEAELAHLFEHLPAPVGEPGQRSGTRGLGLAISRGIIEAMGGSVSAEALPGHGNRFRISVPFRPGAAPPSSQGGGALRILMAEDIPASRLLLKSMLERAGHQVTEAADGPAALAALHGATFDLAVLDLHMPSLGGLGVARVVRSLPGSRGRLPLIALTADPAERMEADCSAAGFDAMLRKPFETRRLLGLIDSLRGRTASDSPVQPLNSQPTVKSTGIG